MKFGWDARIALLYIGFVALIVTLVVKSMHQDYDLVATDYYQQEIEYQKVIDAGKNQAALSAPVQVNTGPALVTLKFPAEFTDKPVAGKVQFYSSVNAAWDKSFDISTEKNEMSISRDELHAVAYKVKMTWRADEKDYYQETEINLN